MLEKFSITSFRGISELELGGLSRINILVGTNGAGKTSILEALALMANPLTPGLLNSLGTWREMPPLSEKADYGLRTIFANLDENIPIQFDFTVDGSSHHLRISASNRRYALTETQTTSDSAQQTDATAGLDFLVGVEYDYKAPSGSFPVSLRLVPKGFETRSEVVRRPGDQPVQKPENLGCFYIHARRSTSAGETSTSLTSIYESKKEGEFIRSLQMVDPRLQRLIPGFKRNQPVILADIGLPRLIPVNALGDGFCRVLLMLTGLSAKARLLIVDEIDSGVHSSVMIGFWASLLALTETANVQIVCTTHSDEMLRTALEAFEMNREALRVFRIDRHDNDEVTAQSYDYETLAGSLAAGLDIR